MKKFVLLMLAGSTMVMSMTAFAFGPPRSGFYLEGNIGYSYVNEKVINSGNDNNDGIGWNINFGYLYDQNWAFEGGFTKHTNETLGAGPRPTRGSDNYVVDLAVKGIYPLDRNVKVFGKLGPAWVHHTITNAGIRSGNHNRLAVYGGAGGAVTMTRNLDLTVQVNGTTKGGNTPSMIMASVGLTVTV